METLLQTPTGRGVVYEKYVNFRSKAKEKDMASMSLEQRLGLSNAAREFVNLMCASQDWSIESESNAFPAYDDFLDLAEDLEEIANKIEDGLKGLSDEELMKIM